MPMALSRVLLDRLFSDAGVGVAEARPPTDWKEMPDVHVFKMDLPGLPKERVAVEVVDGRILRVRGGEQEEEKDTKDAEAEEEGGDAVRWHCRERVTGAAAGSCVSFVTQFRLPQNANAEGASARMVDGVLTVTVPKSKTATGRSGGTTRRPVTSPCAAGSGRQCVK